MAAWPHYKQWNKDAYAKYRAYCVINAPLVAIDKKKKKDEQDCADLSMELLIDFASSNGLPVTFVDLDFFAYISKADLPYNLTNQTRATLPWTNNKALFKAVVQKFIQVKSLWQINTIDDNSAPKPGDLMMKFSQNFPTGSTHNHHCALVYDIYPPFKPHPLANSKSISSFPGNYTAWNEMYVLEYFMGTTDPTKDHATVHRNPDGFWHFDYLNSRGSSKRIPERIYFANYTQMDNQGYSFRNYNGLVLDNWDDWSAGWPDFDRLFKNSRRGDVASW